MCRQHPGSQSRHCTLADVAPQSSTEKGDPGQLEMTCSRRRRPLGGPDCVRAVLASVARRAMALEPFCAEVGTTGQPARRKAWGDSGNKILWHRARAGLRYTDFCPVTNSVVTGASTSPFSSIRRSAPLRCVKRRPYIGKSKCPPNAQDSFGPTYTTNNFSFSMTLPVGIYELPAEDQGVH